MKLFEIWKRLGKAPVGALNKEAVVLINGEEHIISKILYNGNNPIGFETKSKYKWFSKDIKPNVHKWVVVRDADGIEYTDHQWVGHAWYDYCRGMDGTYDGWRTDVDVVSWRYQEE